MSRGPGVRDGWLGQIIPLGRMKRHMTIHEGDVRLSLAQLAVPWRRRIEPPREGLIRQRPDFGMSGLLEPTRLEAIDDHGTVCRPTNGAEPLCLMSGGLHIGAIVRMEIRIIRVTRPGRVVGRRFIILPISRDIGMPWRVSRFLTRAHIDLATPVYVREHRTA